jgi:hypothetical protein
MKRDHIANLKLYFEGSSILAVGVGKKYSFDIWYLIMSRTAKLCFEVNSKLGQNSCVVVSFSMWSSVTLVTVKVWLQVNIFVLQAAAKTYSFSRQSSITWPTWNFAWKWVICSDKILFRSINSPCNLRLLQEMASSASNWTICSNKILLSSIDLPCDLWSRRQFHSLLRSEHYGWKRA